MPKLPFLVSPRARNLAFAALVVLLAACAATEEVAVAPTNPNGMEMVAQAKAPATPAPPRVYRFYPGDELSITAVNRPELTISTRVDPHGYIPYPYLGQVRVQSLSAQEIAEHLSKGLVQGGYYTRPAITVGLVASKEQFVYVLGEVKKAGPVGIAGTLPLLAAVGRAGGATYEAEMSTVLWIRPSQSPPGVVKLDLRALGDPRLRDQDIPNLDMVPGDVLFVPDTVIASVERFFNRMFNIIKPMVELERGLILYPDVEKFLKGETDPPGQGTTVNIIAR